MNEVILVDNSKTRTVPLIPVRDVVVYPTNEVVLTFGRKKSIQAIDAALAKDKVIALFTQKDDKLEDPEVKDLYDIGTLCVVERTLKTDDELNALVKGIARIKLIRVENESPIQIVEVVELTERVVVSPELEALARHLTTQFREAVNLGKSVEFTNFMRLMSGVGIGELADQIAATLNISLADRQLLLEILDVKTRLYKINELLAKELKILEIEKTIASKTQEKFSKNMKENVLRERMNTIKAELGELDDGEADLDELHDSIHKLKL